MTFLQNTVKQLIEAYGATQVVTNAVRPKLWTSGYVILHAQSIPHLKHPRDLQLNGCQRQMGHPKEDPRQRRLQPVDI